MANPVLPSPPVENEDPWWPTRSAFDAAVKLAVETQLAALDSPSFTGNPTAPTPATADNDTSIATTAFVKAQGYSPLASPAFTGNPTAPTPAAADNDTSIATTAFVQAALALLINAAPGALDTLDELAAAMGDDPNFAATMTNALALKAPLASPVLTGNPTAPTPAAGDNDLSIATTAFVTSAIAAVRGSYVGINAQVGTTYTPVASDVGKLVTLSNVAAITVSLPQDSAAVIAIGQSIDFLVLNTGMATFTNGTGATKLPTAASVTRAQYTMVSAIKIAANTWLVTGDVA